MLDFNTLLKEAEIDPSAVLMIRHSPKEPRLRQILPWLVHERPDLFLAWQRIQWRTAEVAMTRAQYVAAFIAQDAGKATFAGMSRVAGWNPLPAQNYWSFPGNQELRAFGMEGGPQDDRVMLAFDLEPVPAYQQWLGKLVVDWPPPDRAWWRWAAKGSFAVSAINDESRFARAMPPWDEITLDWAQLHVLPLSWRAALSQWRGVYFIFDVARSAGYVGAAYGQDNLMGRWLNYAATGHAGNKRLRDSAPENLRFSILQRTSPDLEPSEVIRLEATWKERLRTREYGLNEN